MLRGISHPGALSSHTVTPTTEEIHTSTGYQAVVNHLLEKVMGQMGSYGTGVFGESTVSL